MINTASLMRILRGVFVKQDKTTITSSVKKKNIVQTPFVKLFIFFGTHPQVVGCLFPQPHRLLLPVIHVKSPKIIPINIRLYGSSINAKNIKNATAIITSTK